MKFKNLFLSIILLASCIGVRAMENGQNLQEENVQNNQQNQIIINPAANLHHQQNATLTPQACTVVLAIGFSNSDDDNLIPINLKQTLMNTFNNAIADHNVILDNNFNPIISYLNNLVNGGHTFESTMEDNLSLITHIDHLHQQENTINTDTIFSQNAQILNTVCLNQNLLNAANAIIQAAQEIINTNNENNNQNDQE